MWTIVHTKCEAQQNDRQKYLQKMPLTYYTKITEDKFYWALYL